MVETVNIHNLPVQYRYRYIVNVLRFLLFCYKEKRIRIRYNFLSQIWIRNNSYRYESSTLHHGVSLIL